MDRRTSPGRLAKASNRVGPKDLGHLVWNDYTSTYADATGVEWVKSGPGATAVEHFHPEAEVHLFLSRPVDDRFTRMQVTERIFPHAVYPSGPRVSYFRLYRGYWAGES